VELHKNKKRNNASEKKESLKLNYSTGD